MTEGPQPGDGSSPAPEPDPGEQPPPGIEARIDELADAFLEEAQAGLEPDPGAMAARHPELAPWLEREGTLGRSSDPEHLEAVAAGHGQLGELRAVLGHPVGVVGRVQ